MPNTTPSLGYLDSTSQLNNEQLAAVESLSARCRQVDKNSIPIYPHVLIQNRALSCNLFYYHKNLLVGFLSPFYFYEDACEVAVMVDPDYRHLGIATKLLNEVLTHFDSRIQQLYFSTPHQLSNDWLKSLGMVYKGSEYQMQRQKLDPVSIDFKSVAIRPVTSVDIPILCALDLACFPGQHGDMITRFQMILDNPAYSIFIANQNGIPVGKAHFHWHPQKARISDIAIFPHMQGQGLGSALLALCINHALDLKISDIILEVETNNLRALNIYNHQGFTVANVHDYWTIPLVAVEYYLTDFIQRR